MIVREIIASLFFILGVFVYITGVIGVFKFKYVLNRMHCAALGDTLGLLLVAVGAVVYYGFDFASLKVVLVLVLLWLTSPVASHMIALLEANSNPDAKNVEYKEMELNGKEKK